MTVMTMTKTSHGATSSKRLASCLGTTPTSFHSTIFLRDLPTDTHLHTRRRFGIVHLTCLDLIPKHYSFLSFFKLWASVVVMIVCLIYLDLLFRILLRSLPVARRVSELDYIGFLVKYFKWII